MLLDTSKATQQLLPAGEAACWQTCDSMPVSSASVLQLKAGMRRAVLPAAGTPAERPAGPMPGDAGVRCQIKPVWRDLCCLQ